MSIPAIGDDELNRLAYAGPNDLVDLWTIQSGAAVGVLGSRQDLIANDAVVFPDNPVSANCNWKRHAYCWMREQMVREFDLRQQAYDGDWPIWAWAVEPQQIDNDSIGGFVLNCSDAILHLRLPKRSILFSWHPLWERLLRYFRCGDGAYFAINASDNAQVCPNYRVPSQDVCERSWPRMFCLDPSQVLLPDCHVLQATIAILRSQYLVAHHIC